MSNFARIDDGSVIEVIQWDPAGRYPEDWQWEPCPVETKVNSIWDGKDFTNPVKVERVVPTPEPIPLSYIRYLSLVKVAGGLSSAVATSIIDGTHASDEVNFLQRLMEKHSGDFVMGDPMVQSGLDVLLSEGVITQVGRDAIEANWPVE
jgi:hypothetical protein